MKRASDIDISTIDIDSPEFGNALSLVSYTNQSVFLTGKAGTGKSTFIRYLTATTKKSYVLLAPTGIAAVNAGGQTIHSFFKLPFKPVLPGEPEFELPRCLKDRLKYNKQMVKLLRSLDLIIIDEVSMVRADIIDYIDRILRVYCGNQHLPFAGKQLLLVGDVFQLEPVVTGDVKDVLSYIYKSGTYFFNARAFDELAIVPIELTKVYRQSDPEFIGLLDRIRAGSPTGADITLLNHKVQPDSALFDNDFTMTIATRRDIVDRINQNGLNKLPAAARTFTGIVHGDFPETSLPTDRELVLKEGAQIVFVKNDMERRWVNGSIGRIAELTDSHLVIEMEDGTKHEVEPEVWENVKYVYDEASKRVNEDVIGTYTQFPVKLAWALTIHKSQGLTFDKVIIDIGRGAFSGGQTYVALSRCKSLAGIKLRSTINPRDVFVNPRILEFSRSFNDHRLIAGAMDNARAFDCYARAARSYDEGRYSEAASLLARAVNARNMLHRPEAVRLIGYKLARITGLERRVSSLEQEIEQYRRRFAQLAGEYVEMAEQVMDEGWDMQDALANYDKALSLCPDYALAWLGKGLVTANMGDLDGAVDALCKAAECDPGDYRPYYEAGRMLVGASDLAQGMDFLLKALARNRDIPQVHDALADLYLQVDDHDNADRHRRMAAKLRKAQRKK